MFNNNQIQFIPDKNDLQKISEVISNQSGFEALTGPGASRFINYRFYSFKVINGSCYISAYTTTKVKDKATNKEIFGAILLRKYQKGGYRGSIEWKVAKTSTCNLKWKCMELARKWRAQKLGIDFIPSKRTKIEMSEERRAELANRMLDCAGRIHNLPVFDLDFTCSACSHKWEEVTYEQGVSECPSCGFAEAYDKRSV